MLQIKRAYLPVSDSDGYRVLVDRLWPRGKSKETEKIDLWLKEIAPSPELRKWFNHEVDKYPEFQMKYREELQSGTQHEALEELRTVIQAHDNVTLVYSAKDEQHNNAQVLYDLLNE
ncbi:DUF488 domain-containing protein [Enterococcus gilvus]|uniref:DUF488 domain-containing protein n=1 Tax=Enterococcus gilvus TaxID=160453 RepID=UPI001C8C37A3|nr:DUF488 domain-containing protein [Enterococcus gilvus]MBX8935485.1 DUF488 domain-containing protein [Enterococcus gilvus]